MYNQGFSRISNEASSINRRLAHPENVKKRDQFLQQAISNLKNLSTMDLSQSSNVNAALGVFRPFYDNTELLQDMAFAAKIDSELRKSESDRTKDHGKYYNQSAIARIKQIEEDYKNDSPNSLPFYQSLMLEYFPYQNYNDKILDLYSKFKPSKRTRVDTRRIGNAVYDVTTTMVGIDSPEDGMYNSADFRRLLELSLSPLEKQQIYLDGMMQYGRNPQFIEKFKQSSQTSIQDIDEEIAKLEAAKNVAKTDEEKSGITANIDAYKNQKSYINSILQDISGQDPKKARAAMDNMAAEMYYDDIMQKAAMSVPNKEISEEKKLNEIWKIDYQDMLERNQKLLQAKLNKDLEDYKRVKSSGDGFTGDKLPLNVGPGDEITVSSTFDKIEEGKLIQAEASMHIAKALQRNGISNTKDNQDAFVDRMQNIADVYNTPIVENGLITGYKDKDGKVLEFSDYQDLQAFNDYKNQKQLGMLVEKMYQELNNQIEKQVEEKNPEDYKVVNQFLKQNNGNERRQFTARNLVNKNGEYKTVNLSLRELYDLYSRGEVEFPYAAGGRVPAPGSGGSTTIDMPTIIIKGEKFYGNEDLVSKLEYLVDEERTVNPIKWINDDVQDAAQRLQSARKSVATSNKYTSSNADIFDDKSDLYKKKRLEAAAILGTDPNNFILEGAVPLKGQLLVRPVPKKDETVEDAANRIIKDSRFGGERAYYDEKNKYIVINDSGGMNVNENFSPALRKIMEYANWPIDGTPVPNVPGMYVLKSPALQIGNFPYNFQFDRIKVVNSGPDGTKVVSDLDFNIYVLSGNQRKLISQGMPIDNAAQLATVFSEFERSPKATAQLVESVIK